MRRLARVLRGPAYLCSNPLCGRQSSDGGTCPCGGTMTPRT